MVTQLSAEGLTSLERSLVEYVSRGELLDLAAPGEAVDESAMRSWRESRTFRASVIRDILRGRLAAKPDPHGLRLRGARITGRLDLENLTTDVSLELADCLLEEGVLAQQARMRSVRLRGCLLEHPAEPPLDAAGLVCSVLDLREAMIIGHAAGETGGAVCLSGARISGHLDCTGARLSNDSGPALLADGVQVGLGMFLRYGFTATGDGELGAVCLRGAHIGIHLVCTGARLCNDSGPALFADGLQVGQNMYLTGGFVATGGGGDGAVNLTGAHISGNLVCTGARLSNDSGPGLLAYCLQVDGDMYLTEGFTAIASGRAAVRLTGAYIGGNLNCLGARLSNDSGPALLAYGVQVGQDIYLTKGFTATGTGENDGEVTVNLRAARVNGAFDFEWETMRLEHQTDSRRRLSVDGLAYTGVPRRISPKQWRELLRNGTPYYAAQPYQQLAAGYRALGDDRQARKTLMAQRDDQLARTHPRRRERLWGWVTKITVGYGYQPWRALLFLAAVVALSCVLAVTLGSHGALTQTDKTANKGQPCTVVQQVSVGLDLNLPVGTSVARAKCDLTENSASATAAWLSATSWALRLMAWAFAALFIAGFTSAVRKA